MDFRMWSWCSDLTDEKTKIITFTIAIFMLIWFIWIWNIKKAIGSLLPPGPRGLPIIGYLPFLQGNHLHRTFTKLARVYGPVYKVWLANKLYVVVSSPSLVKQVLRDQDTAFANPSAPIAMQLATYGANDIGFSSYGHDWKKLRKIFVSTLMSNASLNASYPFRKQEIKNTIEGVYSKSGKPINISELSGLTLLNSLQKVIWGGMIVTDIAPNLHEYTRELMALVGAQNISDIFPMLSRFDIQGIQRKTKKVALWFDEVLNHAIKHHRNMIATTKEDGKKDFLQILLQFADHEDSATSITMNQLKATLMDVIMAGTDTTSTMVEWTFAELMLHPEVMKKIQEELAQIVGMDNFVEESHLPKLNYLEAVVKEALRLHPALPLLIPRPANDSGTIGGYTIPKGTTILLNVWAIHRDPQLWENPLQFKPDRILNVGSSKFDYTGNNFQYIPFGSGRRVCAGIPLAERTLMFLLASLLHSFDWKLPYGTKVELFDNLGIVIKKAIPLVVIPTPRLSNSDLYE